MQIDTEVLKEGELTFLKTGFISWSSFRFTVKLSRKYGGLTIQCQSEAFVIIVGSTLTQHPSP
jgi:hypothetical protein